jgi:hypothetical protein
MKLGLKALVTVGLLALASVGSAAPPGGGGGGGGGSPCKNACNILDTVCRVIHTKEECDKRLKDCKAKCTTPPVAAAMSSPQ